MLSLPFVQITLRPFARNTDREMSCHNLDRSLFYFVPQEKNEYHSQAGPQRKYYTKLCLHSRLWLQKIIDFFITIY